MENLAPVEDCERWDRKWASIHVHGTPITVVNVSKTHQSFCQKGTNTIPHSDMIQEDRESSVVAGSRAAVVGSLSWFSVERLKLLKKMCWGIGGVELQIWGSVGN